MLNLLKQSQLAVVLCFVTPLIVISCNSEPNTSDSALDSVSATALETHVPVVELDANGLIKDSVRTSAEAFLFERLNNPDSYQLAKLETTDKLFTQRKNLEYRIDMFNSQSFSSPETASEISELLNSLGESADAVACYVYEYSFRATNAMGGIVLTNSYLYITPDYRVVRIAQNDGERLLTCNELQEYRDIVIRRRR